MDRSHNRKSGQAEKKETQSAERVHFFSSIPISLIIVIAMIINWLNKPSLKKDERKSTANSLLSEKSSPMSEHIIENQAKQKKETQSAAGKIHLCSVPIAIIISSHKPAIKNRQAVI